MPRPPSASYKSRDRGSLEFESRLHEKEGKIMNIAKKDVTTIPPSLPIKDASEMMVENGIRRLPITSPGTEKLQGMVVSRDIVDFLGGGEKHGIIQNKHEGNFLSAINDSSRVIMNPKHPTAKKSASIPEVAKILLENEVGGAPIIDRAEKVIGIVTERDFANYMPAPAQIKVEGHMTKDVVTETPDSSLLNTMKKMISKGFRRLPVIEDGKLFGIITSVDVLKYFGTNEMFKHMKSGGTTDALSIPIEEIMTKNPVTTTPETDLGRAARKMAKHDYGGLPVLKDNTLVGIVTERDMLEVLL